MCTGISEEVHCSSTSGEWQGQGDIAATLNHHQAYRTGDKELYSIQMIRHTREETRKEILINRQRGAQWGGKKERERERGRQKKENKPTEKQEQKGKGELVLLEEFLHKLQDVLVLLLENIHAFHKFLVSSL